MPKPWTRRHRQLLAFTICAHTASAALAQIPLGSAFTHQGKLKSGGVLVNATV